MKPQCPPPAARSAGAATSAWRPAGRRGRSFPAVSAVCDLNIAVEQSRHAGDGGPVAQPMADEFCRGPMPSTGSALAFNSAISKSTTRPASSRRLLRISSASMLEWAAARNCASRSCKDAASAALLRARAHGGDAEGKIGCRFAQYHRFFVVESLGLCRANDERADDHLFLHEGSARIEAQPRRCANLWVGLIAPGRSRYLRARKAFRGAPPPPADRCAPRSRPS